MNETVLAVAITVTCEDGSSHDGVTLKMIDERVVYETSDGDHLCGVKFIDGGSFVVPIQIIAMAIEQYRKQEAQL